jgi:hypothetical protein
MILALCEKGPVALHVFQPYVRGFQNKNYA